MKVYCVNCYWIRRLWKGAFVCDAPENQIKNDTFFCIEQTPIDIPENLNKNNDCSWYKARPEGMHPV
jgi:hypothetical protein